MRNLCIFNRDQFGHITFGIKSVYISGIDAIVQKFLTAFMSETKTTVFGDIVGSEALKAARYSFNSQGSSDFKIAITDDIANIVRVIKADDIANNLPIEDRLKSVNLLDIVFDKLSSKVYVSLLIASSSASRTIKLPVI